MCDETLSLLSVEEGEVKWRNKLTLNTNYIEIRAQQVYCIEEYQVKYTVWDTASSFGQALCTQHMLELELLYFFYYYKSSILDGSCDKWWNSKFIYVGKKDISIGLQKCANMLLQLSR